MLGFFRLFKSLEISVVSARNLVKISVSARLKYPETFGKSSFNMLRKYVPLNEGNKNLCPRVENGARLAKTRIHLILEAKSIWQKLFNLYGFIELGMDDKLFWTIFTAHL